MSGERQEWWFEEEDEPAVSFQSEEIEFELSRSARLSEWIKAIIKNEGCQLHQVSFIFCSDEYLLQLNQEYLNHDTYTDIITFPYTEPPLIEGDIFISIERVRENAAGFGLAFEQELHRVMIHGILHLCGYPDKTPEEASRMRQKEEEALKLLKT